MSDILIKNIEMPKSCPCKLVGVGYDMYCTFAYGVPSRVREYYECCEKDTRPDWCPIIELPKHGRLIDVTDMERRMSDAVQGDIRGYPYEDNIWDLAFKWLDHEPTIIEASGEE